MQKLNDIKEFFKEYPLYKEFLYIENYVRNENGIVDPFDFYGLSFEYFCEEEKTNRTFEIDLPVSVKEHYGKLPGDKIPKDFFDENNFLNYNIHLIGICKSCQKKQADFLISVKSNQEFPDNRDNILSKSSKGFKHIDIVEDKKIQVSLTKVGVLPEQKVEIDESIQKYFDRETNNWYFKGVKLYQQGFGIGSLSYFRRIVEKELMSILSNVSELNSSDPKLKKLIEDFNKNSKISSLYKNSFSLLPKSLQILGDNPFDVLYSLTSEGLHNLTEKESLNKADKIHKLLDYVVKKIYEEKSELQDIRELLKDLKK
ncbi:hypothetical protein [uncultured Formosa sp.]|uniref:hypothetical protein n=1 Tax=uncultured Formosa sp. TaxID=255435 RepID=UPI002630EC51|nr:hypothetical protein [uncultured Formosa sp.]